jgi:hypothetical protein
MQDFWSYTFQEEELRRKVWCACVNFDDMANSLRVLLGHKFSFFCIAVHFKWIETSEETEKQTQTDDKRSF